MSDTNSILTMWIRTCQPPSTLSATLCAAGTICTTITMAGATFSMIPRRQRCTVSSLTSNLLRGGMPTTQRSSMWSTVSTAPIDFSSSPKFINFLEKDLDKQLKICYYKKVSGTVVELVDTRDLKSLAQLSMRVRFPPELPSFNVRTN